LTRASSFWKNPFLRAVSHCTKVVLRRAAQPASPLSRNVAPDADLVPGESAGYGRGGLSRKGGSLPGTPENPPGKEIDHRSAQKDAQKSRKDVGKNLHARRRSISPEVVVGDGGFP